MIRLVVHGFLGTLLLTGGAGVPRAVPQDDPSAARAPLSVDADAVRVGPVGRPWLEYCRGTTGLKPHLRSLITPGGIELLRDGAPGHEHHHGLMLAYGVDDVDYWGEMYAEVPGREVGRAESTSWIADEADGSRARIRERVRWVDPRGGRPQLEERRELEVHPGSSTSPLRLTWRSHLALAPDRERATLWGRPYFGLGLRLAEPLERVGRFSNSEGAEGVVVRGDERLISARWCAYTAEVEGRTVTLALFDHPRNPRHPARFFTMAEPFAYLSATLDLAERPLELARGETLDLAWGLVAWEHAVAPEDIEQTYRAWITTVEPPASAPPRVASDNKGD